MVLKAIRKISGKKQLAKIKPVTLPSIEFKNIRTVGLVFYIEDVAGIGQLKEIQQHPFLQDKTTEIICWLKSGKKKPHPVVEGMTFVDKADFTPQFMPASPKTKKFIAQPFDLLIDLTTHHQFSLHGLTVWSKAGFKAGQNTRHNKHYQLRISLPENKSEDPHFLLHQVIEYLSVLF